MGIKELKNIASRRQILIHCRSAVMLGEEYAISYLPQAVSIIAWEWIEDGLLRMEDADDVESFLIEELKAAFTEAVLLHIVYDGLCYDDSHYQLVLDATFAAVCSILSTHIESAVDSDNIVYISDSLPLDINRYSEFDLICEQLASEIMTTLGKMDMLQDNRYMESACDIREEVLLTIGREVDPDDHVMVNLNRCTVGITPTNIFKIRK